MKVALTISSLFLIVTLSAQTLYVPEQAVISGGSQAVISSSGPIENNNRIELGGIYTSGALTNNDSILIANNGDIVSNNSIINNGYIDLGQNTTFNSVFELENAGTINLGQNSESNIMGELFNDGVLNILEEASINIGGDVSNQNTIRNLGLIVLQGNWDNQGTYDGLSGNMEFRGGSDQLIFNENIQFSRLIINSAGKVTLTGNTAEVFEELVFQEGILTVGQEMRLVVDNSTVVTGGSDFSYFEGPLILQGGPEDVGDDDTETKFFPLGKDGRYNPVTLLSIQHEDFYEISAELFTPNPTPPNPGQGVIGVSEQSVWRFDLLTGSVDSAKLEIDFFGEDLSDSSFTNINDLNADIKRPVVVYADGLDSLWTSLGAVEYSGDSLTRGLILSENSLSFDLPTKYVAIGKAAKVPDDQAPFIPEAFAPGDRREANQLFKIFGEKISPDNFRLVIVNRFNNVVYETTEFEEHGWDGRFNGMDQPAGIYYYEYTIQDLDGNVTQDGGFVYLVR